MAVESILFVCTANICRSPMAEALLRAESVRRGRNTHVTSAGVDAVDGRAVSEGSVAAMARRGIDISDHLSAPVSDEVVDAADLVLTMEAGHVVALVGMHPERLGRTFTLRELVELLGASSPGGSIERTLEGLGPRSARDLLGADLDVRDPFGRSARHYRRCADELEALCAQLADGLWGPA